jgi:hypothetical protein
MTFLFIENVRKRRKIMSVFIRPLVDTIIKKRNQLDAAQATKCITIDEVLVPETTSSPADTLSLPIVDKLKNSPIYQELYAFISNIELEQKAILLAVIWLGRGEYTHGEWNKALEKAKEYRHELIPEYIITLPDVCVYLKKGLEIYTQHALDNFILNT